MKLKSMNLICPILLPILLNVKVRVLCICRDFHFPQFDSRSGTPIRVLFDIYQENTYDIYQENTYDIYDSKYGISNHKYGISNHKYQVKEQTAKDSSSLIS